MGIHVGIFQSEHRFSAHLLESALLSCSFRLSDLAFLRPGTRRIAAELPPNLLLDSRVRSLPALRVKIRLVAVRDRRTVKQENRAEVSNGSLEEKRGYTRCHACRTLSIRESPAQIFSISWLIDRRMDELGGGATEILHVTPFPALTARYN